jgi:hypothetical protein
MPERNWGNVLMPAALKAGVTYFLAVFALGFLFGTLRTAFLSEWLGETGAVAVELPFILAFSWVSCGVALKHHAVPRGAAQGAVAGVTAFILVMIGEVAVSLFLADRTIGEHFALYETLPARLGLIGQLAFANFPIIQLRAGSTG